MKKIPLLFFLLLSFSVKADYEALVHKTYAERRPLLRSFYISEVDDPKTKDVAVLMQKVNAIAAIAKKSNDKDLEAEAALMLMHVLDKKKIYSKKVILEKLDSLHTVAVAEN